MNRLNHPWLWLLVQAGVLWAVLYGRGQTVLQNVSGDSDYYVQFAAESVFSEPALRRMTPPGYPLFLQAVEGLSDSVERVVAGRAAGLAWLPVCHYLVHVLAVLVGYAGLSQVVASRGLALAAASCLLYSNLALTQIHYLMSDAVAAAAALAAIGFLLRIVRRSGRWGAWLGLTCCLFAAWFVRPAYLFLAPLVPLLGVVLLGLVQPHAEWVARRLWLGVGLAVVGGVPLLAWCLLRYAVVGHFAVASASGINLLGVVGPLLTEDVVHDLPAHLRGKATRALATEQTLPPLPPARHEAWDRSVLETGILQQWDRNEWYQGQVQYLSGVMQEVMYDHNQHNRVVFLWFGPLVVAELEMEGDPMVGELAFDRKLAEIAGAILKARPGGYALGVLRRTWQAVVLLFANNLLLVFLLLAAAGLASIERIVATVQQLREGENGGPAVLNEGGERNVLFILAFSFALAKILLMVLVVPPVPRYIDAAGVLLPLPLVALLAGQLRRIRFATGL